MKTSQIVIDKQLISYITAGSQKSQPLLLLHGWRSSAAAWHEVMSSLEKDFCVYALDLPGFGASSPPIRPYAVADYANVVAHFIEKMDLGGVSLVGHSVGGRIAIKLAASRPELLGSLVLVDSAGFVTAEGKKKLLARVSILFRPFFKPKFMKGPRKAIYRLIGAEDYVETPELVETFKLVVNEDLTTDMKLIKTSTLIVWGERDIETPLSFAERMKTLITDSRLVIIPGAGHFSFLDNLDTFTRAIKGFYEEL